MSKLKDVIRNLNGSEITFELEDSDEGKYIYISTENTSGCEYKVNSVGEIGKFVADYLLTYFADESEAN